jgi:probable F420-dependent oxidoreductase
VRHAVQLPTDRVEAGPELIGAEAIAACARAAEAAGFDAVALSDHPCPPARWVAAGGHHTLDPWVALSFAAAATTRLRLMTQVLVLPYRSPFLVAKAAATLDVLSGGRLVLGVAPGYLAGEFAALGADFATRNEVSDEAIDVLRAAWRGEPIDLAGRGFAARGNLQRPRPARPGGPPIWVGGNSRRALRRAVERGDGWMPFPAPRGLARHTRTAALETLDDLRAALDYARAHAAAVGRGRPLDVCLVPFGFEMGAKPVDLARLRDEIPVYAALGVTWLAFTVPAPSRAAWCEGVAALGDALGTGRGAPAPAGPVERSEPV